MSLKNCIFCNRSYQACGGDKYCSIRCLLESGIEKSDNGCWHWKKAKDKKGYGSLEWKGHAFRAHRISYGLYKGNLGKKKLICHTCDNPSCVNPEHLFIGSHKKNSQDMVKKNRSIKGLRHFHKYSWEEAQKCYEMWKEGKGAMEIGSLLEMPREAVSYLIKKHAEKNNIPLPPRLRSYDKPIYKKFSREKVERLLYLRNTGETLQKISEKENVSLSTCHYILNNPRIIKDINFLGQGTS